MDNADEATRKLIESMIDLAAATGQAKEGLAELQQQSDELELNKQNVSGDSEEARRNRIEAALRTSLEKRCTCRSLEPHWWSTLQQDLARIVESDPEGSIAQLAIEASGLIVPSIPRSVSKTGVDEIQIEFGGTTPLDYGTEYLWVADVEASWDGGPWQFASSGFWTNSIPLRRLRSLGDSLGVSELDSLNHVVRFRSNQAFCPPDVMKSESIQHALMIAEVMKSDPAELHDHFLNRRVEEWWPGNLREDGMTMEDRSLGDLDVFVRI